MSKKEYVEEFSVSGEELLKKVKAFVRQGNIRRIIIKNDRGDTGAQH